MNSNLLKAWVALFGSIGLMASSVAFGGGDSSSGGGAMVCRDAQGNVKSAELLDLWEVQLGSDHAVVSRSDKEVHEQIADALLKIKSSFGDYTSKQIEDRVAYVQARVRHVPPKIKISAPQDAMNDFFQEGCALEGVAKFSDKQDTLWIDNQIFEALPKTDQAALWIHEAVYFERRNAHDIPRFQVIDTPAEYRGSWVEPTIGDTTSIPTRLFVGRIFSNFLWTATPVPSGESYIQCSNPNNSHIDFFLEEDDHYNIVHVDSFPASLAPITFELGKSGDGSEWLRFVDRPVDKVAFDEATKTRPSIRYKDYAASLLGSTPDRGAQMTGYGLFREFSLPKGYPFPEYAEPVINGKYRGVLREMLHMNAWKYELNPKGKPSCKRFTSVEKPLPW